MKTIMRMLVLVCILLFSMPVISDAAGHGLQTHDQIQDQTKDQTYDKLQDQDQDQLREQTCLSMQTEGVLLSSGDRDCTHDQLRLRDQLWLHI